MSVLNRLSDLINSNINSILDQAEDPHKMVRHIIREMQATLAEVRSATSRHKADNLEIRQRLEQLVAESENWQEKAEVAILKNRDDLARAALQEKTRLDDMASTLEKESGLIDASICRLEADAQQLETKLNIARTRQKALILRGRTAKSRLKVKRQLHLVDSESALAKFDAYEQKLDDMEAAGEAIASANKQNRVLAAEINALEDDSRISKDLAGLKARMSL